MDSDTNKISLHQRSTDMETLHLIGNAHLDPVWFWPWQEG